MELMDPKRVRVRPPRRIDVRNQIKIFDEDLAIIDKYLRTINNGFFCEQRIRFYAVLPTIDSHGHIEESRKNLVLITHEYLIYAQIFNFVDFLREKNQQKTLLLSEKLAYVSHYSVKKLEHKTTEECDHHHEEGPGTQYFLTVTFQAPKVAQKTAIFQNLTL